MMKLQNDFHIRGIISNSAWTLATAFHPLYCTLALRLRLRQCGCGGWRDGSVLVLMRKMWYIDINTVTSDQCQVWDHDTRYHHHNWIIYGFINIAVSPIIVVKPNTGSSEMSIEMCYFVASSLLLILSIQSQSIIYDFTYFSNVLKELCSCERVVLIAAVSFALEYLQYCFPDGGYRRSCGD